MQLRKTVVSLATAVLVIGGTTSATASDSAVTNTPTVSITALDACSAADLDNDRRLGPAALPLFGAVGAELFFYDRTGGQPRQQFLDTWWDPAARSGNGDWIFPPQNGYMINADGTPIRTVTPLTPGQEIDRFGGTGGGFLAPKGLRYADRSIPPSNLDSSTDPAGCNYHVYRVLKTFSVYTGTVRPWFDQPGNGQQYQLDGSLVPGAPADGDLHVQWLLDHQYLEDEAHPKKL